MVTFLLNKSPFLSNSCCCILPYHFCRWHGSDFRGNGQNWDLGYLYPSNVM